jgi:hypothetical protein
MLAGCGITCMPREKNDVVRQGNLRNIFAELLLIYWAIGDIISLMQHVCVCFLKLFYVYEGSAPLDWHDNFIMRILT